MVVGGGEDKSSCFLNIYQVQKYKYHTFMLILLTILQNWGKKIILKMGGEEKKKSLSVKKAFQIQK